MSGWGKKTRRYKKTEEKILSVFLNHPEYTMQKIAKKVGIARSTIYLHHHSIRQIIPDCEKDILEEYDRIIRKKLLLSGTELKNLYLETLIFIFKNRQVFEMFLKFENREIIIKMLLKLEPKVREQKRIFRICMAEIAEIIFEWGEKGFSEEELERVLSDAVYLTLSIRKRLASLA